MCRVSWRSSCGGVAQSVEHRHFKRYRKPSIVTSQPLTSRPIAEIALHSAHIAGYYGRCDRDGAGIGATHHLNGGARLPTPRTPIVPFDDILCQTRMQALCRIRAHAYSWSSPSLHHANAHDSERGFISSGRRDRVCSKPNSNDPTQPPKTGTNRRPRQAARVIQVSPPHS